MDSTSFNFDYKQNILRVWTCILFNCLHGSIAIQACYSNFNSSLYKALIPDVNDVWYQRGLGLNQGHLARSRGYY